MCHKCARIVRPVVLLSAFSGAFLGAFSGGGLPPEADNQHAASAPVFSYISKASAAETKATETTAAAGEEATTKWTCPMHPHYIADEFGTCPICGMDLVKLETGNAPMGDAGADENRPVVTIAPEMIQNIGVRLGKAEMVSFGRTIRSYGTINENERLVSDITARVEGWIGQLKVKAVGDRVEKGMMLFDLYSPKLEVSQRDYIGSVNNRVLAEGGLRQLKAFGVQEQAIKKIVESKGRLEFVPFYAERSGTLTELYMKEDGYINRGMLLARIQDYSSVWLIANVAEKDLSFISRDTSATVLLPNLVNRSIEATVDYIYPTIDPSTRTGKVRLVIDNPNKEIRPGSYADIVFNVDVTQRLAVPSESVLKSGAGRYVVVSMGEGRFQSRKVKLGMISEGWTEIISGLEAGENIVVSGQFLIDSEASLRESFHKLQKMQMALSLLQLSDNDFAMVDHFADAALYMHEALVDGYDVDPAFLDAAISVRDMMWPRYGDTQLGFFLEDSVKALKKAQTARTESELQQALEELVTVLLPWIGEGAPGHYREKGLVIFKDTEGRHWLQTGDRPYNPYGREEATAVPYAAHSDEASAASADDSAGAQQ